MREERHQNSQQLYDEARAKRHKKLRAHYGPDFESAVALDDFYAYMPMHAYIYTPARDMWPGASVNARIRPFTSAPTRAAGRSKSPPLHGSTKTGPWSK